MSKANATHGNPSENMLAELAAATSRMARRQGFTGALIDIELDLWYAHQALLSRTAGANPSETATAPVVP